MMTFRLPGIGVAAVLGSDELAGAALALVEGEAFAEEEALALGDPLSSTKVVVLSPPHPASTTTNAT